MADDRLNDSFYEEHHHDSETAGGAIIRLLRAPQRDAARLLFQDFCSHRGSGPIRRGGARKVRACVWCNARVLVWVGACALAVAATLCAPD